MGFNLKKNGIAWMISAVKQNLFVFLRTLRMIKL